MSDNSVIGKPANEQPMEPEPVLPAVDLLDRILFFPFIAAFGLSLFVFDPIQRLAFLFGQKQQQRVVLALNWCLKSSLALAGVRIRVDGEDPIPPGTPLVIISNHQSMFDIPILHCALRRHWPRFLAKRELGKWIPSVSFNLRKGGNALIDRSNPRQAIPEIQRFAARLSEQAFGAVIFPEGTRARTGALKPFRPTGVTTLLSNAENARVLAVAIDNSWVLSARKFGPVPRGTVVHVRILGELDRTRFRPKEIVEQAETTIREGIRGLREEITAN